MKRLLPMLAIAFGAGAACASEVPAFNREIRPLLSDRCIACHGPDEAARKGGLRLDRPGADAVDWEEVLARVASDDPDERMPPPRSHKPRLDEEEFATLQRWIEAGAVYEQHWAFQPLAWSPEDDIDTLVAKGLAARGLNFAPEAPRHALLRRLAFDLTGLPPTPELFDLSYEEAVETLLASPHFGEHLAVAWLDAARYADTNGYFGDKPRQIWPWRDWVIEAFNANLPYDRFTIEQLAGDLLPDPGRDQLVATGFNRNHMVNNETGIVDEEFRVEYVVDRVDTTVTTWLGLTASCAQCHDHKYDPISQREFFQLFAFFNSGPETGLVRADNPPPVLELPSPEQEEALAEIQSRLAEAKTALAPAVEALAPELAAWEGEAPRVLPPPPGGELLHEGFEGEAEPEDDEAGDSKERGAPDEAGTALLRPAGYFEFPRGLRGQAARFEGLQHFEGELPGFDPDAPWTLGFWIHADGPLGCPLSLIEAEGDRRGLEAIWQRGRLQVNLVHRWGSSAIEVATVESLGARRWHHVAIRYDGSQRADGVQVFFDGTPAALEVRRDSLDGSIANDEPLRVGRRDANLGFYGELDELRLLPRALDEEEIRDWLRGERIRGILDRPAADRSPEERDFLLDDYLARRAPGEGGGAEAARDAKIADTARQAREAVREAEAEHARLREEIPLTLVMEELPEPRPTHVLDRGEYDQPREAVSPGVPESIAPWDPSLPPNRLGLARWIVSADNALAARVAANRFWAQCFGEGLVRTPDDFGSQGELPTHPELLDWLAGEFRGSGWDVKALLRSIVLSRTYRQDSSIVRDDDPENRLLARGPSGRLSAEMLRDQALALSGLLVPEIGGPSVKPLQPPGLWEAVSYDAEETYVPDSGDGLWRRGLYTYVKRQSPHPMLLSFDGPTREKCSVRRSPTNTPMQALLLLNDETFLRAAEALAQRSEGQNDRLGWLFRTVTARTPEPAERDLLEGLLERRGCWTLLAHTLLNLDEAITKQ